MISRNALLAALVSCFTFVATATAQDATRVGIMNPARVFQEMQETKDLKQKLENDRANLQKEIQTREGKVKDLAAARDLLKPESPQFAQAEAAFMKEAIEYDTWSKITQATLQGQQKQQMKVLFDKIVAACNEVAQAKGIDLIVADQRPDLPENLAQVNVDQLRAILNGRNIMYLNPKIDVSNDIIAALDAKYRAGGGASTAAPAPAPAGGAAPAPAPAPAAPKR